jgi:hypothetical protein
MGGQEGEQEENESEDEEPEEEEEDFDLSDFRPLDNNLCSVLGEQVRKYGKNDNSLQVEFTPHFKRNYEKWLEDVVFKNPVNWDNVLMPTEQLERQLRQQQEIGM